MKALTVRQPWAWAIMHAKKDIENRDWYTRFRGRVAIHSSASLRRGDKESRLYVDSIRVSFPGDWTRYMPSFENLITGSILGTVDIVDCVEFSPSPWFFGRFGFVLRDPRPLAEPIPCKGALSFWDVPEEIAGRIK